MLGLAALIVYHHASGHVLPGAIGVLLAVSLVIGAIGLFLRRRVAFFLALGAAILTFSVGAFGMVTGESLGLPVPPIVTLVAGLYMTLRTFLARDALGPPPVRELAYIETPGGESDGPSASADGK